MSGLQDDGGKPALAFRNNLELWAASQGRVTSFLAPGISKNSGWRLWRGKRGSRWRLCARGVPGVCSFLRGWDVVRWEVKGDSYYVSCLETQLIVTNLKNVHNFSPGRHTHTHTGRQTHSVLNPLITCLLKTLQGLPICKSALYAECDGGMEMSNCSRWRPPKKRKKEKGSHICTNRLIRNIQRNLKSFTISQNP